MYACAHNLMNDTTVPSAAHIRQRHSSNKTCYDEIDYDSESERSVLLLKWRNNNKGAEEKEEKEEEVEEEEQKRQIQQFIDGFGCVFHRKKKRCVYKMSAVKYLLLLSSQMKRKKTEAKERISKEKKNAFNLCCSRTRACNTTLLNVDGASHLIW